MKMICDVPDEVIKSVRMCTWCGSSVLEKMIVNGTPIPDNATNGDVIEKVFNTTSTQFCELVRMDNIDNGLCCSSDWWNSLYQKGGKE